MRRKFLAYMWMFILFLFTLSCEQHESEKKSLRQIQFKINDANLPGGNTGGRMSSDADLDQVEALMVTVTDETGAPVYEFKKVKIYKLNEGFISEPLTLAVGHYALTMYAYIDADDNILAATPLAGSEMADYVEEPLPIEFDITESETTYLNPEVIWLDEGMDLESIGYLQFGFGFNVVHTTRLHIQVIEEGEAGPTLISGQLNVNASKDAYVWSKQFEIPDAITPIYVKGNLNAYDFTLTKPGYETAHLTLSGDEVYDDKTIVFVMKREMSLLSKISFDEWQGPSYYKNEVSFEYDEFRRLNKRYLKYYYQYPSSYTYVKTFFHTNDTDFFSSSVETTNISETLTLDAEDMPSILTIAHPSNSKYTYEFTLDYNEAGLLTHALGRNTTFTQDPTQEYYFQYNANGDLETYECWVNGVKLWDGGFEYYDSRNVIPVDFMNDYVNRNYVLYANDDYDMNKCHILPFLIGTPEKLIMSSYQNYYATNGIGTKSEHVSYAYQFTDGQPVSGTVTWYEAAQPQNTIEKKQNIQFEYYP